MYNTPPLDSEYILLKFDYFISILYESLMLKREPSLKNFISLNEELWIEKFMLFEKINLF
jgi:hypothetical protein